MEKLMPDVYEKILVTLDVKNLNRFKSVCKSWKFLISDPRFIKAHLNHSCSNNNDYRVHRKTGEVVFPVFYSSLNMHIDSPTYYIIGSSNGLVCIRSFTSDETLVINPATREEKMLPKPPQLLPKDVYKTCWGFGYDSVSDDYKVVLGVTNDREKTCFQVLSLKSNAWTLIGQLNYTLFRPFQRVSIFCNGALHWAMYTPNQESSVILSFDLSHEEFTEILQPIDSNHQKNFRLVGIMEECLCILTTDFSTNDRQGRMNYNIWVMQKYNVNQSWKKMERLRKFQPVDRMTELENDDPNGRSTPRNTWFFKNRKFTAVPNIGYVESLVSPHL